jgi:hypothetical protein
MDFTSVQYEFSQASPLVQAAVTTLVLMLIALSTWFWSVTLDRLFDSIGTARRLRNGAVLRDQS